MNMLPAGELRISIEEKYGTLPYFLIYALLEWVVIILLFVDGFLAFVSNEIARFFQLKTPCLLCTRLDHLLVRRSSNFYYNESICEVHKKDIATLSYCHVHKRLSDIRSMCQACLLSSDKDSDYDHKHKPQQLLVEDDRRLQLKQLKVERERERFGMLRWCSCCGEPTKSKSSSRYDRSCSSLSMAASASPREREDWNMDLQSSRYTELKLTAGTDSELRDVEEEQVAPSLGIAAVREEMIEDPPRSPTFASRNKFFGIPLSDAASPPPPLPPTSPSKKLLEKSDLVVEEAMDVVEGDQGDIVARLKRQVTHDRRSLMALYMELDEERSASAVAANNAMAMITRLQAEKAAVQMEASQYKRMMEEQAEYDQEAMQMMKNMLLKREEEMQDLERELDEYKERFGIIKKFGSEVCEMDLDEDNYQDIINSSHAVSSSSDQDEINVECRGDELAMDYERERDHLVGLMRELVEGGGGEEGDEAGVSLIRRRLKAVEAESGFLKHAAMTLQRGGEGMKILSEIAQNLRKLRQNRFENLESCCS